MRRLITRFKMDEHGDWVAFLSCGHTQHVRHRPPFEERPWVITEVGRREKLGKPLDCIKCDHFEMPDDLIPYRRTAEFNERTIPQSLRRDHSTKPGIWAKIQVIEGKLNYRIDALGAQFELSPEQPGIVIPEARHHVNPIGSVRFLVEFYKMAENASDNNR
jgi:tellurite methyltransferase